ncbi:desulfoferrodoxin family protein [Treponema sp.]|uniref:desulfoferrodoxin family protein n=1 Tax=Treponema sp. TaxID=166 RepID=UPI00298E37FC|nr:desulfoferrodoxin family protein [Treponema sp.]MCR5612819.1 desulfoferrodoxin [Treponema sp.]
MEMKFYKCPVCGKVIAVLNDTGVPTICCGQEMVELRAGTTDAAVEKHVPVITTRDNLIEVTVGSVIHPMEEKHYIMWIALVTEQGTYVKHLEPGQEPKVAFSVVPGNHVKKALAYCNLHGLWASN